MKISLISIALRPTDSEHLQSTLINLLRWAKRQKKIDIQLDEKEKVRLQETLPIDLFKSINFNTSYSVYTKTDLMISLGGDGTLIGICQKIKSNIPIFGINLGKLGFIAEFSKTEFFDELDQVVKGKYDSFKVPLSSFSIHKKSKLIERGYFINDVVLNKNDIARMFSIAVDIEDEKLYNISGDGLIISSPIGSTAYSLAAGGPIVHPNVRCFIITPICPHSLTFRPLVIPKDFKTKIRLLDSDSVNLTIDGQKVFDISDKHLITVFNSKKHVTFIENKSCSYFTTLKEKFINN